MGVRARLALEPPSLGFDAAAEIASKMLGMRLVTHQTGPEGRIVQRLLIEQWKIPRR